MGQVLVVAMAKSCAPVPILSNLTSGPGHVAFPSHLIDSHYVA